MSIHEHEVIIEDGEEILLPPQPLQKKLYIDILMDRYYPSMGTPAWAASWGASEGILEGSRITKVTTSSNFVPTSNQHVKVDIRNNGDYFTSYDCRLVAGETEQSYVTYSNRQGEDEWHFRLLDVTVTDDSGVDSDVEVVLRTQFIDLPGAYLVGTYEINWVKREGNRVLLRHKATTDMTHYTLLGAHTAGCCYLWKNQTTTNGPKTLMDPLKKVNEHDEWIDLPAGVNTKSSYNFEVATFFPPSQEWSSNGNYIKSKITCDTTNFTIPGIVTGTTIWNGDYPIPVDDPVDIPEDPFGGLPPL